MFSFFQKKAFLKDHLKGLVDIHNHILPGIDDGAATVEDSIALIKKFSKLGVTSFIATPHIMNDFYPNTPNGINDALNNLQQHLSNSGLENIQIKAAAEYMMDQSFLELLNEGNLLTLSKNLVLVEMSYFQAPINLNEILFQLQTKKYRPILAHPERYVYYHSKDLSKYRKLKGRGCAFQLNLLSLTGHYGKNIQETAFKLLDNEMVDFVGSDTHQMRHIEKLMTAKLPQKRLSQIKTLFNRTSETFMPAFH